MPAVPDLASGQLELNRAEALEALKAQMAALRPPSAGASPHITLLLLFILAVMLQIWQTVLCQAYDACCAS